MCCSLADQMSVNILIQLKIILAFLLPSGKTFVVIPCRRRQVLLVVLLTSAFDLHYRHDHYDNECGSSQNTFHHLREDASCSDDLLEQLGLFILNLLN